MAAKSGAKGYVLEELLRAYFIRAGLFAVRGVPLQADGEDLTDIDIWLYERPTGSSRRRQIVDVKSKLKPKAAERLFLTKGLYELLAVDGAYVATTDTRSLLKDISRRLGIQLLDGSDLKRITESEKIVFPNRLTEEELDDRIKAIDKNRRSKTFQIAYHQLKCSLLDNFGPGTVNRSLDHFGRFSAALTESHPNSAAAEVLMRLCLIAASFSSVSLDACLSKVSFKSSEDRRRTILNVVRYGDEDEDRGIEKVRVAIALIAKYGPNGSALSQSILRAIREDYERIPAEIIVDHVLTHLKSDGLFSVAKSLDSQAFNRDVLGFDELSLEEKGYVGSLLDFVGTDRAAFAEGWKLRPAVSLSKNSHVETPNDRKDIGPLFKRKL
jgi:hypothetical protein